MYLIKGFHSICIYTSDKMQAEDKSIPSHRSTVSIKLLHYQKLLKLIFQLSNTNYWYRTVSKSTEPIFTELASNRYYSKHLMHLKTWMQLYRDMEN